MREGTDDSDLAEEGTLVLHGRNMRGDEQVKKTMPRELIGSLFIHRVPGQRIVSTSRVHGYRERRRYTNGRIESDAV